MVCCDSIIHVCKQKVKVSRDMDEQIIQFVSKRPFIYDKSNKNFKNSTSKKKAWAEIAEKLESNVETVKRRWKNLRDQYIRELRLEMCPSKSKHQASRRKFAFWDQMDFLRSSYKPKSNKTNSNLGPCDDFDGLSEFIEFPRDSSTPKDTTSHFKFEEDESTLNSTRKSNFNSSSISGKNSRSRKPSTEDVFLKFLKEIKPVAPPEDHITHFVKNIEGYMRSYNLTVDELLQFQQSIFDSFAKILERRNAC